MSDTRSSSALFKRAEQLKRWEESDTNKQSCQPRQPSRIQFSSGIVFLAACTAGDRDEVQRLLKMGADINTANVDGLTALHQGCIDDNLDMVEFLVQRGADVNRGDNEGWTPLHATASCGFLSIARFLLENGADVAAVNYDGELPVDIAESDAMEELLQKAIDEKGIDCEQARNAEVNALLTDANAWAANGYLEVQDLKTGGTPLHVAAAKGYIEVAKTLLELCSADPDSVDYEGWTPLHAAALWGQKEAAALLLKYGADPHIKNYSGQTCMELVDPSMSNWLSQAVVKASSRNNNKTNKRRRSPPRHDVKRPTGPPEAPPNDKPPTPPAAPKAETKPPKGRAPSPDAPEPAEGAEAPSWRRSASYRGKQTETQRTDTKTTTTNSTPDNDTILRRTHSFENDKTFYQRYRDVTARIKATSCPSIPPERPTNHATESTNDEERTASPVETRDRDSAWSRADANTGQTTVRSSPETPESPTSGSTTQSATPTKLSPGNIFKNFFKSFVPPVRDEESETQRKAHAKRVRETRRSTQGVTLDEIKSAEQLVKKKTGNGTAESPSPPSPASLKKEDLPTATTETTACVPSAGSVARQALASATATATATIAATMAERRPSWRLRLDPANKFELEDAGRGSPRPTAAAAAAAAVAAAAAGTTITLRRPPAAPPADERAPAPPAAPSPSPPDEEKEKEREGSVESKSGSPASTQAALNVIQRRRRPKRRSTGVGHVDMDDIANDRGGGDGDVDTETVQSGGERPEECEDAKDYKALWEASQVEVRRLRSLLGTSEQQLRDARATITRLTQVNQNSLSEIEKREKRAMERKLSEMEEELKYHQTLQAENQRLKDENGALIRVISKLSK